MNTVGGAVTLQITPARLAALSGYEEVDALAPDGQHKAQVVGALDLMRTTDSYCQIFKMSRARELRCLASLEQGRTYLVVFSRCPWWMRPARYRRRCAGPTPANLLCLLAMLSNGTVHVWTD